MRIEKNCIINKMPEDVYHNDPTPESAEGFAEYTSLSSSVALAIVEKTEIEARMKINRFNPKAEEEASSDAVNLGSMVHDKVLLGGQGGKTLYEVVPFDSFRTQEAKDRRDDLIARGIIPLAKNQKTEDLLSDIDTMVSRLHEQLAKHQEYPNLLTKGQGEQSGFYLDEKLGIWKRARFDWLDDIYEDIVWDYKTTSLPTQQWINNELWKEKYIQCPHYTDVYSGITGEPCKFGFILQRTVEPFLVDVVVIDESFMDEVRGRYDRAQQKFANCLRTGIWNGSVGRTIHACPPPWILNQWETDVLNDEINKDIEERQQPKELHAIL